MTAYFKENRTKFDDTIALVGALADSYVLVGFQEGSVTHSQVKNGRTKKPGKNMAQIAAENEFGTSRIPARSFMRTSFDENKQKLNNAILNEYDKIIDGKSTIERSLGLLGQALSKMIKKKIREIQTPPNSPRTIREKKSSKPLIDFGQMVQAVTYKVVTK